MLEEERQAIIDDEQLRLLSIGYIISGCVDALTSLAGLFYAAMGAVISRAAMSHAAEQNDRFPAEAFGWIFGVFGLAFFIVFVTFAVMKFLTARHLKQRRSRTLCLVSAAISLIGIPYGTVIGVYTFSVLSRPSVRQAFER